MKTSIKKQGDLIIVSMEGRLDFETHIPLREDLNRLIPEAAPSQASTRGQDSVPSKVIFNLERLEFVGSSGISSFVQTLKDFNAASEQKPRYCNVKSEFRRVIKAFDDQALFEFYENEERARKSFDS